MARHRAKKKVPTEPVQVNITSISHEGRGIASIEGKTAFVSGALPGEVVKAKYVFSRSKFDELVADEILEASPHRVSPPCPYGDVCGGCSLQHVSTDFQVSLKENVLLEQFQHFAGLKCAEPEMALRSSTEGYRRKARLGVRYVTKRDQVLVGFREKRSNFITDVASCCVLDPRIGQKINALQDLIRSLSVYQSIPQIEVAVGDDSVALVFRHLEPLTGDDKRQLFDFGQLHSFEIFLQPKGPDSVWLLSAPDAQDNGERQHRLSYRLEEYDVTLQFHPMDFTQVNAGINRQMVHRALEWLDLKSTDRVLDLFCGLGNFTIPLATICKEVVGVEGDEAMVMRGRENASYNGLSNVTFFGADLQADFTKTDWAREGFDKILIDPPRSGAEEVVRYLSSFGASRIVYVSCNPATLARDSGIILSKGYKMVKAGIMDMFPHTAHVESIALFEKI